LDPQDNPADNLVTFHAAFIWQKEDFLEGGDTATVSLDAESSISFESTRWWDNVGQSRWILQSDTLQLYISQFSVAGAQDDWGTTNELFDPLSTNWAIYNPSTDQLDFDQSSATWIDPVTNNLFNDIQAVGVYIENDTPSGELTKFSLVEIQFNAVVAPAALAAVTSDPHSSAAVFSLESLNPNLSTAGPENELLSAALMIEPDSFGGTSKAQDSAGRSQSLLDAHEAMASFESPDSEELSTELQDLDDAFTEWLGT